MARMTSNFNKIGMSLEPEAVQKRQECWEAIPQAWRISEATFEALKYPLHKNKNNVLELDVPRRSGILGAHELSITEDYDVARLLEELKSGKLTSLDVTVAFSKRAAIAQQLVNCVTETCFEAAQKRARYLDAMREAGQLAGPLHGLPVSLKDSFQVKGTPATIGMTAYLDHKSTTNSALVDMLLDLGAVVYCKTNVPLTLMSPDSHNYVFGRTLNPWNTMLGAGGSSGGEGALLAMRGSPLGVGTDIAGSIRIPALCNGTYGFRPTAGRIPYGGQQSCSNKNLPTILACAGPMANDLGALDVFMKAVVGARPRLYDATANDVPWRSESAANNVTSSVNAINGNGSKKLRLGILAEDAMFPLHPPVRKAVDEAVQLLEAEGHEMVRLTAEECRVSHAMQVAFTMFDFDKTPNEVMAAGGESSTPGCMCMVHRHDDMTWGFVTKDLEGCTSDLQKLCILNGKRKDIADTWRMVWKKHGIDGVVGPAAQNTAVEHDEYGFPPYTVFLNVLDYPACVIPFGKATAARTAGGFELSKGQTAPPYRPENIQGAPCAVQVFTSTMRDEECLEIAKVMDQCFSKAR